MERLVRELVSGGASADDVVQIHGDYEQEFMNMKVLQRINWKDFNVVPQLIHRDSYLLGVFTLPYVFVYNSKLVKKEEAPKTWNDFLDPKWKGKFVVDSRPSSLLFLASTWGQEKVLEYAEKLGKNKPIFVRGQTRTMILMSAEEYMISATGYLSTSIFVNQKGATLEWNIPEVVPLNWGNFAILNGAKHPNAAKVFLGWMGSKGYKLMDKVNWGRSAPFGGTRTEKLFEGKRLSFPPSYEQVPNRQELLLQISKNLGLRK
ncbi:MAG: extracellular solute-binding protein [Pseudomonadota bacterium]